MVREIHSESYSDGDMGLLAELSRKTPFAHMLTSHLLVSALTYKYGGNSITMLEAAQDVTRVSL